MVQWVVDVLVVLAVGLTVQKMVVEEMVLVVEIVG